jgi:hypothetical protein
VDSPLKFSEESFLSYFYSSSPFLPIFCPLHTSSPSILCSSSLVFLFLLLPLWSVGHPWKASFHFSSLILETVGRTPWTGDQPVAKPLPNTNTDRYPCIECDSKPRSQFSRRRRHFMPQTARPLGSADPLLKRWIHLHLYSREVSNPELPSVEVRKSCCGLSTPYHMHKDNTQIYIDINRIALRNVNRCGAVRL